MKILSFWSMVKIYLNVFKWSPFISEVLEYRVTLSSFAIPNAKWMTWIRQTYSRASLAKSLCSISSIASAWRKGFFIWFHVSIVSKWRKKVYKKRSYCDVKNWKTTLQVWITHFDNRFFSMSKIFDIWDSRFVSVG